MGFGSKTTTKGSSTSQQTEDPNLTAYRMSLIPQYQALVSRAQQPMYGAAEQANYFNQANAGAQAASRQLASQLASRGVLDSGAYAGGLGDILQKSMGQKQQFAMDIPRLNRQQTMQDTLNALQASSAFAGPQLRGSTGTSEQIQTSTPGLGSVLGSLAGAALGGAFPGLGMIGGGGGFMGKLFNPLGVGGGAGAGGISIPGAGDPYAGLGGNGWGTPMYAPPVVNPVPISRGYDYYSGR